MKKIFLLLAFAITTISINAQNVLWSNTKIKLINGATLDTVFMSTLADIASYVGAVSSSGTVTSVAMTVPTGLTVTGSPITTSGTLALTNNMSAGVVKSAGVSGALTSGLVNLASEITGTAPVANGGTGATTFVAGRMLTGNGTSAISQPAFGSDNQIWGMNNAGTAYEHKTISVGTSGTDFAVALTSANAITLNLPDASGSNRGAVTTGAQTLAGLKTFSGGTIHTGQSTVAAAAINGAQKNAYTAIVSASTLSGVHNYLGVTAGSAYTITLPANATAAGWEYVLTITSGTGLITLDPSGAETFVDSASAKYIQGVGTSVKLQNTGSGWILTSN